MPNRTISYLFTARDRFSRVADKVSAKTRGLRSEIRKMTADIRADAREMKKFGNTIQGVGRKLTAVSAGVLAAGIASVNAAGKNEALTTSYEVMAGSAEKGQKLVKDLYAFAAKTPFEIGDLGNAGKQLLAMGIDSKELIGTLGILGDMAAATNRPIGEFALVWGQIMSTGFLTGGDAMQLTNKGIGIRQMLAEELDISISEVYDLIAKRQIPATMVRELLVRQVSEGGRFFQMMDKVSGTLPGIWSNTMDLISQASIELGSILIKQFGIKESLEGMNQKLSKFIDYLRNVNDENPAMAKLIKAFFIFAVALGPVVFAVGSIIAGMAALKIIAGAATITVGALLATVGLIGAAILLVIATFTALYVYWDEFINFFKDTWQGIIDSFYEAESLSILGMVRGGLELVGAIDSENKSTVDLNIGLNDPGNNVQSVQTSSNGPLKLNTGQAMAGG